MLLRRTIILINYLLIYWIFRYRESIRSPGKYFVLMQSCPKSLVLGIVDVWFSAYLCTKIIIRHTFFKNRRIIKYLFSLVIIGWP